MGNETKYHTTTANLLPSTDDIDDLIERLLDAQQDINLSANETMNQQLCDASALIDEVEKMLRLVRDLPPAPHVTGNAPAEIWAYDDGAHIMAFDYQTTIGGAVRYVRADLATAQPTSQAAPILEKAIEALRPLSDAVFNDNGDMSVSQPLPTYDECVKAYFVTKQIRNALEAAPAPQVVGDE